MIAPASSKDARVHAALGVVYAGLGRADDAIRSGEYAVQIYPPSIDAYIAPGRVTDLVTIYALLEQNERALDHMEKIVGVPPHAALSPGWIQLHPLFDGMRDNPRLQSLLKRQS